MFKTSSLEAVIALSIMSVDGYDSSMAFVSLLVYLSLSATVTAWFAMALVLPLSSSWSTSISSLSRMNMFFNAIGNVSIEYSTPFTRRGMFALHITFLYR